MARVTHPIAEQRWRSNRYTRAVVDARGRVGEDTFARLTGAVVPTCARDTSSVNLFFALASSSIAEEGAS